MPCTTKILGVHCVKNYMIPPSLGKLTRILVNGIIMTPMVNTFAQTDQSDNTITITFDNPFLIMFQVP